MQIIRADVLGCCAGVRSALDTLDALIDKNKDKRVFTIGPLIHNNRVLEFYGKKGVSVIHSPKKTFQGNVGVIRTHGVTPAEKQSYIDRGVEIVDCTCARVQRSHRIITGYADKGYFTVILGDPDHGEVISLTGYAKEYKVISTKEQAESLVLTEKTLVIAQTTISAEFFHEVCAVLKEKQPELEFSVTLCPAVDQRQKALLDLAGKVEAIIVIGGKNSANTTGLYKTAVKCGLPCLHIESEDEIPGEFFSYERIGITAGASTTDWIIEKVEGALLKNRS